MSNRIEHVAIARSLTDEEERTFVQLARAARTGEDVRFTARVMEDLIALGLVERDGVSVKPTALGRSIVND